MNLLMKEKMTSVNEDSILCHDISNDDENVSENEELSVSLMQLNEKYIIKFIVYFNLLTLLKLLLFREGIVVLVFLQLIIISMLQIS